MGETILRKWVAYELAQQARQGEPPLSVSPSESEELRRLCCVDRSGCGKVGLKSAGGLSS